MRYKKGAQFVLSAVMYWGVETRATDIFTSVKIVIGIWLKLRHRFGMGIEFCFGILLPGAT
jgi:hypothetical protein